jgi:hypothetical protein
VNTERGGWPSWAGYHWVAFCFIAPPGAGAWQFGKQSASSFWSHHGECGCKCIGLDAGARDYYNLNTVGQRLAGRRINDVASARGGSTLGGKIHMLKSIAAGGDCGIR